MPTLPTGTVSLLFSDVEGSTLLLQRLGPAYAQAVDGQRQVQRAAWAAHGGVELGTEGDSFYVVFPTAEGAVKAAVQAQRELAVFEWPAGERVRVRMGIHTGAPTPHDGAYVGMDVHRAARIAGAAHGGQVLVSQATAALVSECLPNGVGLKDLGSHQLKDIPAAERVFQLIIAGLQVDFPPVKTLGASSSLPRPATPLVGRDGELAELTALLDSPEVRLVTLTGPGGSGKTRLAIGVAERLVDRFPDGVYFVPLAAVTTADVMWTTIAEVLDVPPEGRIPPGFFDHVARRTALFVLDNLEQVPGADEVVDQLLEAAPQVVVIASSRRPLHLAAEQEHPVPPLQVPADSALEEAAASGAVQLFVQRARKVRPSFRLNADNAPDVVELCRRLDGLPLAIELAAARTKLLSPKALVARLDQALDLTASDKRAARQRTLRDTIAWSYNLLDPTQQAFFRRLGVFAGGADLDAITAVTADVGGGAEAFDLVGDLVDASLVTMVEDDHGEPRIELLETIRSYALIQLEAVGELEKVRTLHARHFTSLVEACLEHRTPLAGHSVEVRKSLELELYNLREVLSWTFHSRHSVTNTGSELAALGRRLLAGLGEFWAMSGHMEEGLRWLRVGIQSLTGPPDRDSALLYVALARLHLERGEPGDAKRDATVAVERCRQMADSSALAEALSILAVASSYSGDPAAAQEPLTEALRMAAVGSPLHTWLLVAQTIVCDMLGESERVLALSEQMLRQAEQLDDPLYVTVGAVNFAIALLDTGNAEEAKVLLDQHMRAVVDCGIPAFLFIVADSYSRALVELRQAAAAARIIGANDVMRERTKVNRPDGERGVSEVKEKCLALLGSSGWEAEYTAGRSCRLDSLLLEANNLPVQV